MFNNVAMLDDALRFQALLAGLGRVAPPARQAGGARHHRRLLDIT
jgi:hypothetical protein